MDWTKLKYSKNQINKAGETLVAQNITSEQQGNAMDILSNWRSSHSFPLHVFTVRLSRLAKQIDQDALIVRRLKRVPSILKKLKRGQTNKMDMSRMQDVGGCRTILHSMAEVNKLVDTYKKRDKGIYHKLTNKKDYIQTPKEDGYRSIHLIYKYFSDKNKEYEGSLIEIQIRTKLQHYWATAIETVDHFTRQAIKTNEGEKDWMDFFKLVSSAFAGMEKTPIVPNTPEDTQELKTKIQALAGKLKVVKKMNEWTRFHKIIEEFEKKSKEKFDLYLLNLDIATKELKITAYKKEQEELANSEYSKHEERMMANKEDRDIVLVSAETSKELRKAYPNYFLDTKEFVNVLNDYFKASV
jgi:hypothetical protein